MSGNGQRSEPPIPAPNYDPYALAIGQVTLAWNDLQEALGVLFVQAMAGNDMDRKMQCALVWSAVTNDRQKRQILGAAINGLCKETHETLPRLGIDVLWMIERADSLEDKRNNVVHSPLGQITDPLVAAVTNLNLGSIHPGGFMNQRAAKLSMATVFAGKDLLTEIGRYRDYATALASFSDDVLAAWRRADVSWPERPVLPRLKK